MLRLLTFDFSAASAVQVYDATMFNAIQKSDTQIFLISYLIIYHS
jgi:hypothetical protein